MDLKFLWFFCLFFLLPPSSWGEEKQIFKVSIGKIEKGNFVKIKHIVSNVALALQIQVYKQGKIDSSFHEALQIEGGLYSSNKQGELIPKGSTGTFQKGNCILKNIYIESPISFYYGNKKVCYWSPPKGYIIPGYFSLLPPLLAILLAFFFKEVFLALFLGIWLGATFMVGYNPLLGMMTSIDTHIIQSIGNTDSQHPQIIFFSLMLGGMIGIIVQSGSMHALVAHWSKYIQTRRSAQVSTWGMGLVIFFDDYANTLMVGQTMRPLTDKLKISREKLAYLVDSTAAPVASIAIVSTWIGTELGYLKDYLHVRPAFLNSSPDALHVFLMTIPYRFYSLFTLFFVFIVAYTLRDFGPMLQAERRALELGDVIRKEGTPMQDMETEKFHLPPNFSIPWYDGFIPLLVTILSIFIGLYYTGYESLFQQERIDQATLWDVMGASDSFKVLCWCSTLGCITAFLLVLKQGILNGHQIFQAWLSGIKSMMFAMIILVLAWALGSICNELHTGRYIVEITHGFLPVWILPTLIFILSSIIAFATGTSWGTMAILLPIVIPMGTELLIQEGYIQNMVATEYGWNILMASIAGVLAGATFGDHCSPISDTTVMSSMACACDHMDHVKTQLPYALTTGGTAILVGYLPIGLGLPVWISLMAGIVVLLVLVKIFGKKIKEENSL